MKKPTYIPCKYCGTHRNNPDYDFHIDPCKYCVNTGTVQDPTEILCNNCGGDMCPIGTYNEQIPHGLHKAEVQGGYDSYHLLDLNNYVFNICEKCLRHLFMQFKIPPLVNYVMSNDDSKNEWEWDQKTYEYRIWKDGGHHHQAYLNGKCNVVKDCDNDAVYTHLLSGEFTEDCSCEIHKGEHFYINTKLVKFISNNLKIFL